MFCRERLLICATTMVLLVGGDVALAQSSSPRPPEPPWIPAIPLQDLLQSYFGEDGILETTRVLVANPPSEPDVFRAYAALVISFLQQAHAGGTTRTFPARDCGHPQLPQCTSVEDLMVAAASAAAAILSERVVEADATCLQALNSDRARPQYMEGLIAVAYPAVEWRLAFDYYASRSELAGYVIPDPGPACDLKSIEVSPSSAFALTGEAVALSASVLTGDGVSIGDYPGVDFGLQAGSASACEIEPAGAARAEVECGLSGIHRYWAVAPWPPLAPEEWRPAQLSSEGELTTVFDIRGAWIASEQSGLADGQMTWTQCDDPSQNETTTEPLGLRIDEETLVATDPHGAFSARMFGELLEVHLDGDLFLDGQIVGELTYAQADVDAWNGEIEVQRGGGTFSGQLAYTGTHMSLSWDVTQNAEGTCIGEGQANFRRQ